MLFVSLLGGRTDPNTTGVWGEASGPQGLWTGGLEIPRMSNTTFRVSFPLLHREDLSLPKASCWKETRGLFHVYSVFPMAALSFTGDFRSEVQGSW